MDSELVERFKPTIGRWWGVVGMAMVAFVVAAIVSSGTDAASLAVAVGAVFVGWAAYAALVRPTIHAYDDHLLLRNALSDLRLPWKLITDVDVKQTTCVYTGAEKHHGIAIGKSARYLIRGENRARSLSSSRAQEKFSERPTMTGSDVTGMHYADYVVIRIDSLRKERSARSGGMDGVEKHWAWPTVGVGAVIVAVFVVLVVLVNG